MRQQTTHSDELVIQLLCFVITLFAKLRIITEDLVFKC